MQQKSIFFLVLTYVVFISALITAALEPDVIKSLSSIKFDPSTTLEYRCKEYINQLARTNTDFHGTREGLLRNVYQELTRNSKDVDNLELTSDERHVLLDVEKCLAQFAYFSQPTERPETSRGTAHLDSLVLKQTDVFLLSKIVQNTKLLSMDQRCATFDEEFRRIFDGRLLNRYDTDTLFRKIIEALSSRQLPFSNRCPITPAILNCLDEKMYNQKIRDQQPSKYPVTIEFKKAEIVNEPSVGHEESMNEKMDRLNQDHQQLRNQYLELSKKFESIEKERAELRLKLLEKDNQIIRDKDDQIAHLKSQLDKVIGEIRFDQDKNPLEKARFNQMRSLYQQVYDRELRTNKRLEEAESKIVQLNNEREQEREQYRKNYLHEQERYTKLTYELEREKKLSESLKSIINSRSS